MAKTILIVDENAYIRRELCEVFKRESDFEVCGEAENGLDAIEKTQQLHPNLIILDIAMPVMNGIDAARELRARVPTVPIILVTSYADAFVKEELRSAGVTEVVSKSDISVLTQKARIILLHQNAA